MAKKRRGFDFKVTFPKEALIPDDFESKVDKFIEQLAKWYYDELIDNIHNNTFGYDLKPSTIKRLGEHTPLINSGEYIAAIKLEGGKVYIEGGKETRTGIDFTELSYILEYGRKDKFFDGFPVWRDTFDMMRPRIEKALQQFLKNEIFITK